MRWKALGVDYEMCGKDLIDSVTVSSKICRVLQAKPPENLIYELFLDENGQKISKSKGNGIAVEDWLRYGPPESLSLFMFQQPKRAKRLYFDVIPKTTDEYISFRSKIEAEQIEKKLENPVWHVHSGSIPTDPVPLTFSLLLNLASVCHAEDTEVIWGYIKGYSESASPEANLFLDKMAGYAVNYYRDFIQPSKVYRLPDAREKNAFSDLSNSLKALPNDATAEEIQTIVYEIGKNNEFENLRHWFQALYQVLLGQNQGPRFGSFVALYGISETVTLIQRVLDGENLTK